MDCITVTLRGDKSLHLCFPSRETADHALRELDRDISGAKDGYLIVVSKDDGHRIAFLKRDFRTAELSESDDEGDASPESKPDSEEELTPPDPTELENALAEIVTEPFRCANVSGRSRSVQN